MRVEINNIGWETWGQNGVFNYMKILLVGSVRHQRRYVRFNLLAGHGMDSKVLLDWFESTIVRQSLLRVLITSRQVANQC